MKHFLRKAWLVAFFLPLICISQASAMTIVTRFIGGAAPANAVGGGSLDKIVTTAARIWESAYSDPIVVTLYYGWAETGDAGTHTLQEIDPLGREISGVILFDNSGSVSFFLDPTPDSSDEYRRRSDQYQDFGSGMINAARLFSDPSGDAAGHLDLLSVALHEIGHALGLSGSGPRFISQVADGRIHISENYLFTGAVIPMAHNNSGIVAHFDVTEVVYGSLMSGINSDERRIPSELDILANGQVSGFTIVPLEQRQLTVPTVTRDSQDSGDSASGHRAGFRALGSGVSRSSNAHSIDYSSRSSR
jgi:hypothetical protein